MLTVILAGDELEGVRVLLAQEEEGTAAEEEVDEGPNPIVPELKEVVWGFGSFVVLFLLMRFWLFPAVKKGMDARYAKVQGDLETAAAVREAAEVELADYQSAVAEVRAEAARRIDAARQRLEAERQGRLVEVSATLTDERVAADAETEAARQAARAQVVDAAADVTADAAARILGRPVDPAAARAAVESVMAVGVAR